MKRALIVVVSLVAGLVATAPPVSAEVSTGGSPSAQQYSSRIASGNSFTCVILDTGAVKCWGVGGYGNLGYGNTNDIGDNEHPSSVGTVNLGVGRTAIAIAAGNTQTCAILDTGAVKCWGWSNFGQLGYGNTDNIGDDELPSTVGTVNLGGGRTATQIAAGNDFSCALLDNGTVRCWGKGADGRLGTGNVDNIGDNEAVNAGNPVDLGGDTAIAITAGTTHACAIVAGGNVRCWGNNLFGELGYGNTAKIGDNESVASAGTVSLGSGRTAVAIDANETETCTILDNGAVKCWGYNGFGGLGLGTSANVGDDELPSAAGTADLGAGRTAVAIAAGYIHTCAVLDNGRVRCFGGNTSGQLGLGTNTVAIGDDEMPSTVATLDFGGSRSAVAITSGITHSCAILDTGAVKCWGDGASGRLGLSNTNRIGDDELPASVSAVSLGSSLRPLTATLGSETVAEGTPTATMTVTLSRAAPWPVTASYTTANITATAGADYTAASGSLSFAVGETSKTFVVPIIDDADVEGTETLGFSLGPSPNFVPSVGTLTITSADVAPEPEPEPEPDVAPTPEPAPGYWMLEFDGTVYAYGNAAHYGNAANKATDIEPTPSGKGYWVLNATGSVQAFGNASTFAATRTVNFRPFEFATAISATPSGNGYWVFTSWGRVMTYGDATYYGDLSDVQLNAIVIDGVALDNGTGYYLTGTDGGVFTFGSAAYHGSMGNAHLNAPIASIVTDADGTGYWLVSTDGGIFAFDAAYLGSFGGTRLNQPIRDFTPSGTGYVMVAEDGGAFTFGNALFHGGLAAAPPNTPIVAITERPAQ